MSILPPIEKFLNGLSIGRYLEGLGTRHREAPPSIPIKRPRESDVTIDPPSRRTSLSLPPKYRRLSKWNSKTCPCLTDDVPQLSGVRESENRIEPNQPYVSPLFLQIEEERQRPPPTISTHSQNEQQISKFLKHLTSKLKEAEERVRQQHNLLMAIRSEETFHSTHRILRRDHPIPCALVFDLLKPWIAWPRWIVNAREQLEWKLACEAGKLIRMQRKNMALLQENNKLRYMVHQVSRYLWHVNEPSNLPTEYGKALIKKLFDESSQQSPNQHSISISRPARQWLPCFKKLRLTSPEHLRPAGIPNEQEQNMSTRKAQCYYSDPLHPREFDTSCQPMAYVQNDLIQSTSEETRNQDNKQEVFCERNMELIEKQCIQENSISKMENCSVVAQNGLDFDLASVVRSETVKEGDQLVFPKEVPNNCKIKVTEKRDLEGWDKSSKKLKVGRLNQTADMKEKVELENLVERYDKEWIVVESKSQMVSAKGVLPKREDISSENVPLSSFRKRIALCEKEEIRATSSAIPKRKTHLLNLHIARRDKCLGQQIPISSRSRDQRILKNVGMNSSSTQIIHEAVTQTGLGNNTTVTDIESCLPDPKTQRGLKTNISASRKTTRTIHAMVPGLRIESPQLQSSSQQSLFSNTCSVSTDQATDNLGGFILLAEKNVVKFEDTASPRVGKGKRSIVFDQGEESSSTEAIFGTMWEKSLSFFDIPSYRPLLPQIKISKPGRRDPTTGKRGYIDSIKAL